MSEQDLHYEYGVAFTGDGETAVSRVLNGYRDLWGTEEEARKMLERMTRKGWEPVLVRRRVSPVEECGDYADFSPGQIVELLATKHKGFYLVQHVKTKNEKFTLDVLPEAAWDITDPVARKHESLALEFTKGSRWVVKPLPDHHPVCGACGMMWPCSHHKETAQVNQMLNDVEWEERKRERDRKARQAARKRYETPGICPACQKPVAFGQPSQTFTTNAVIHNGPPVTYHVSRHCCVDVKHHSMTDYQKKLRKKANR